MNKPGFAQSPAASNVKAFGRPAPSPARPRPAAPPVYRPQPAPKVLQPKVASGAKAGPVTPNVCAPHCAPRVLSPAAHARGPKQTAAVQPKAASPLAHAAPKPAGRTPPTPTRTPPRASVVIQRMEERRTGDQRAHNLKVIADYSSDTLKEIRDAFFRAGYNMGNWEAAAKKALKGTQWHNSTIAHDLGGRGSGLRGGTDSDIQSCAQYLITWAGNHPFQQKAKDKSKYGSNSNNKKDGSGKKDDDKGGSGGSGYIPPWHPGGQPAWFAHRTDNY